VVQDYFLVQPTDHRGNVVLHVMSGDPRQSPHQPAISWPLLAVDLAEHSGSRERARAAELILNGLAG